MTFTTNKLTSFITILWCIIALLLYSAYSARLFSIGAIPKLSASIETFQDVLVNQINCYEHNDYMPFFTKLSNNQLITKILPLIITNYSGTITDSTYTGADVLSKYYLQQNGTSLTTAIKK